MPPATQRAPSLRLGLLAALFTVSIWTTWIVSTRVAMGSQHLDPTLLAFIRFGTAALVLAPWWWRRRRIHREVSPWVLVGLLCAGLPYLYAVLGGLTFAPASEAGPLLPGSLPLFIAGLSALFLGERLAPLRILGFVLIGLGVLAIIGHSVLQGGNGHWRGHLLILLAAFTWALYTIAFRKSGLDPTSAAALIGIVSLVLLLPFAGHSIWLELQHTTWQVLLQQLLVQGLLAGVLALILFATAVAHLGPSRTAAITAITPASAVLVAALLLGERPGPWQLAGCVAIVIGVLLASGAIARRS